MYDYDGHGRQNKVTDNAGKTEFVVSNWQSGFDPAATLASDFTGTNHDQNQAVQYAYTAAGLMWKQIALVDSNSVHNQETIYTYNDAAVGLSADTPGRLGCVVLADALLWGSVASGLTYTGLKLLRRNSS